MTPSARLSSAIEILDEIGARRQPAAIVLKEWGRQHRFAGSGDRAAIANLVYDALRVGASAKWIMGEESARANLLGMLVLVRAASCEDVAALCNGRAHGPAPLSDKEAEKLAAPSLADAPAHVRADIPQWLEPYFQRAFGADMVDEGQGLARRAPVDVRVNFLKSDRDETRAALAHLSPEPTPHSPWGLRLPVGRDGRPPALAAEPSLAKGHIELQDEASQLAVFLCAPQAGWQVLDLCAGAGGKSLALAAAMANKGQIYATDSNGARLMPIYKRLEQAGARNVQVRAPKGGQDILAGLEDRCHLVLVDAPCTGSGTWRRHPDAKWRIRPGALEVRMKEQAAVLDRACAYVRPGGRLAYVTCSVLREENEDQVAAFLERDARFAPLSAEALANAAGNAALAQFGSAHGPGFRLSPARTNSDGFYVAILSRVM